MTKSFQSYIGQSAIGALLACALAMPIFGQVQQLRPRLLSAVGMFSQATGIRKTLSGVLDQPGHERRVLSGTVTRGGVAAPFTFTREMDQKVRLDFGGSSPQTLTATGLHTLATPQSGVSGAAAQSNDYDALETLAEDMPEAFLYSFSTAAHVRWLGDGFGLDDGANPNPAGPSYSIYTVATHSGVQPGAPRRNKVFLFDFKTQLLSETRYQVEKNGSSVNVVVAFSGWSTIAGQMVPTSIVRTENGETTVSISINSAASAATQADSLFAN